MNHVDNFRNFVLNPYINRIMPLHRESIRFHPSGIGINDYHDLVQRKIHFYKNTHPQVVYDLYHNGMIEAFGQYREYMSDYSVNQCNSYLQWVLNRANDLEPLRSVLLDAAENYWQNELKKGLPDIVKNTMRLMSGDFGLKDLFKLFTGSSYRKQHNIFAKELEYSSKITYIKSQGWFQFNVIVTPHIESDFYK